MLLRRAAGKSVLKSEGIGLGHKLPVASSWIAWIWRKRVQHQKIRRREKKRRTKPTERIVFNMLEDDGKRFLDRSYVHTDYCTVFFAFPTVTPPTKHLLHSFPHLSPILPIPMARHLRCPPTPPSTPAANPNHQFRAHSPASFITHPTPAQLGIVPYPEWRLDMVDKAHKAGMEDLGLAMQVALCGGNASPENNSSGSEDDVSDAEWEGWMRDLSRQRRVHRQKQAQKESTTAPASGSLSSPLSSSPESDSHYFI